MVELIKPKEWKKYIIAALIFTVVFTLMEIVPPIVSMNKHEYGGKAIAKSAAEETATAFTEKQTGLKVESARAIHQADKLLTGYLAKEKLTEDYDKEFGKRFPLDMFQVNLELEGDSYGFVYIHLYSGDIVGWNLVGVGEPVGIDETYFLNSSFLVNDQSFKTDELDQGSLNHDEEYSVNPIGYKIGKAALDVTTIAKQVNGNLVITKYKPEFVVPDDYKSYVKGQDQIGGWLTGIGYGLMSFILAILAIIYAIIYRKHTSFKYGIILTAIFLIAYIIMNLGVMDGVIASQGEIRMEQFLVISIAITTIVLAVAMAVSVYFSLVAGDGLWKSQGRQLWPRLRDAGYGDYVWRSVGLSYLFALIMLGVQPIIFLALEKLIGTWGANDVSMSPYNMSVLWLMPVLAWAAAISEEAIFRFFGIGLFRKWFRHTFAAAILPTLFWALGHVMYPFYPSTTRLFELMIIGLLFSFIFVRYGFITAMFTHAIFNSVAVGSSLIMVGGADNIASAIIFILLPIPIGYLLKLWSKRKRTNPPVNPEFHPAEQQ
ncbi:CPBP family intramembrane glutamic endopeptidase [Paenibacillus sp. GCM10027627]|uniref:CPBP family intramembrane glutamic endopeptidase n=1 Tax=unclassified Paenibacillus TaxID=185978 RepID=UPI003624E31F